MNHIPLKEVNSSQIHAIGHDPVGNKLAIQFKGKDGKPGSIYHYDNFTAADFAKFKTAESHGTHFAAHIKSATVKHPFKKI